MEIKDEGKITLKTKWQIKIESLKIILGYIPWTGIIYMGAWDMIIGICIQISRMVRIEPVKMVGTLAVYIVMVLMGKVVKKASILLINILQEVWRKFVEIIKRRSKMVYDEFGSGLDKIISTLKIYPNSCILLGWLMTFLGLINLIYFGIREKYEALILIQYGWHFW